MMLGCIVLHLWLHGILQAAVSEWKWERSFFAYALDVARVVPSRFFLEKKKAWGEVHPTDWIKGGSE
jgi:hypothetical protein